MEKTLLLQKLPPFLHRYTMVKKNQSVYDIVKEVLQAHEIFSSDYDRIAAYFNHGSNKQIAESLFNFLKQNVAYEIESEAGQTTKSPSALLTQGIGDCKHYAGFIAGVLDALNRQGRNIDWTYRFASYNFFDREPGHVFVVMFDGDKEYWIDPVLKHFNERLEPHYILDKKPKQMLQRVSGINDIETDTIFLDDEDRQLEPELLQAINLLLQFKVLDQEGRVNDEYLVHLSKIMRPEDFQKLADARALLQDKAVSGLFSSVFSGVKKVALSIPRTAFLQLVLLNFRGYATDMAKIIFVGDTLHYKNDENMNELKAKWENLGGDFNTLVTYVWGGKNKPKLIGGVIGNPAAAAAWYTAAAAIIAAMVPVINHLIDKMGKSNIPVYGNDSNNNNNNSNSNNQNTDSSDFMDFISNNPMLIAGVAALAFLSFSKK